jgi:6-hydroxycyclohex-1-ene-1-carbonyl-CoA dehydrogenase
VAALDARQLEPRTAKKELARLLGAVGAPGEGWHVYECSGTAPGQSLAFSLLTRGGCLGVVGFSPEPLPLKLSNLMALDATAYGNWGADPELYPEALRLVLDGKVDVAGAVERHPLASAPEVLEQLQAGALQRRAVLVPHV